RRPILTIVHALHSSPILPSSFFFHDPPPTEIYTLSLHDALPISSAVRHRRRPRRLDHDDRPGTRAARGRWACRVRGRRPRTAVADRKSTRLNSSHVAISYAVFCLKKKDNTSGLAIWEASDFFKGR